MRTYGKILATPLHGVANLWVPLIRERMGIPRPHSLTVTPHPYFVDCETARIFVKTKNAGVVKQNSWSKGEKKVRDTLAGLVRLAPLT